VADELGVRTRLSAYLGTSLSRFNLLAGGWETEIFEFTLAGPSSRLTDLDATTAVVLRLYQGAQADEKGAHEASTMRALYARGYPIPQPYLYEPSHEPLGAPFLIMKKVDGFPLFSTRSFLSAFKIFSMGFPDFVRCQVKLHRQPFSLGLENLSPACPAGTLSNAPLLDRMLAVIADRIERGPLPGLHNAFTKVLERAGGFRNAPESVVHMDYHPQNVIVRGFRVEGVIDWVSADRGDRHLCAATTSAILASSAMDHPRWMRDNVAGNSLRRLFAALYISLYHSLAPMELARFRYCQSVAALHRLSMFGLMRRRGPEAAGFRPQAITHLVPDVLRILTNYTARKIGVPVSIE
jgi:aminoglycoside phosphotransferase (APT) family kinase protein